MNHFKFFDDLSIEMLGSLYYFTKDNILSEDVESIIEKVAHQKGLSLEELAFIGYGFIKISKIY